MRTRLIIATVIGVVATLTLVVGLIDPLEGGIALLIATALFVAVRFLSRVPMPKLWWIPTVVAIGVGATALGIAIFAEPMVDTAGAVSNPFSGVLLTLLWGYRAAVLVAIAGAVLYVVRLIRTLRTLPAGVAPANVTTIAGGVR